jgi:hypothetical protein
LRACLQAAGWARATCWVRVRVGVWVRLRAPGVRSPSAGRHAAVRSSPVTQTAVKRVVL